MYTHTHYSCVVDVVDFKIVHILTLSSHKIPKVLHISLTFLLSFPHQLLQNTLRISSSDRKEQQQREEQNLIHSIEKSVKSGRLCVHTFDDEDD